MPEAIRPTCYHLLLTGRRNGRNRRIIGFTRVLDDEFTRNTLAQKSWHRTKAGYAATNIRQPDGRFKPILLHRLVYEKYHGPLPPGHEIDHRDRNKINNLPSNLQAVTRSVNAANRGRTRKNRSGYVGVSWDRRRRLWVASISKLGHQRYLGAFTDPVQAARTVNAAYRETYPQIPVPNPDVEPVTLPD